MPVRNIFQRLKTPSTDHSVEIAYETPVKSRSTGCDFSPGITFYLMKLAVDRFGGVRHFLDHMKTATVRELRNEFPRIEAWVHEGETVSITKRGKVIATLLPALGNGSSSPRSAKPDIMARLRETWGGRVFSLEEVAALRADELAEDLG